MKYLTISLSLLFIIGCSNFDSPVLTDEEKLEIQKQQNDSLLLVLDSIMEIKIEIPQLIDSSFIQIECLNQFNQLARETNGNLKIVANSRFVSSVIIDIIEAYTIDNTDIMIILDKTGSMADDLSNIRLGLKQILDKIKEYNNIRLSIATYGDRHVDGRDWFEFINFESSFDDMTSFLENIKITYGGDAPESVYDGIYEAFQKEFWKSESKRIVILLGDAPSLDSTLSLHSLEEIVEIATIDEINMNFYPIVLSPQDFGLTFDVPKMQNINFIESLYPNPCRGKFNLKLNQIGNFKFELFNESGVLLKQSILSGNTYSDELYDFPNGLYLIRISDDNKNFETRKIILNK